MSIDFLKHLNSLRNQKHNAKDDDAKTRKSHSFESNGEKQATKKVARDILFNQIRLN